MKTLLFAPLFIDGEERLERNIQWINYISSIRDYLYFDELFMVDNASDSQLFNKFHNVLESKNILSNIYKCKVRLNRNSEHAYGYWYRAFGKAAIHAIANKYDKIIHIDSDVYLLNENICNKVNSLNDGWNCFWSEMHQYPESTFQVIGKDQFQNMYEFMTGDFLKFYPNGLAENEIPWTNIIKDDFKGDRYGESNLQQTPDMNWYGQKPNHIKLRFNK